MKEIQPVTMWNGVIGIYLNAWATNVTLSTSAVFTYNILNANQERLVNGELTMTGEAYTKWTQDNYAWDWIAQQLNVTIIGDYVPPTPAPTPSPDTSGTSGTSGTDGTSGTSGI